MFAKHYKKILAVALVAAALVIVRLCQAPVGSGAVLDAFDSVSSPASADLKLVFFDVGQGDSSLAVSPAGEEILIDGGPDNSVVQKLGEYLPYDDRKIESVILTHPHADHLTGLIEVLKRYEVGQVIMAGAVHTTADYQEFLRLIKEKNIPVLIISQPQDLAVSGINLSFLEPAESYLDRRPDNLNNSSLVFKLRFVSTTALYLGDFENEEELTSSTVDLKSDLLKVGHHGSTNANDRDFLAAVKPGLAVISAGAGNKFGHPHYRTLYYLQQLGARIFRTDELGDLVFTSDGRNYQSP